MTRSTDRQQKEERRKRLTSLIGGLCTTFDKEYNPLLVDIYDKALKDLSIEQIELAVEKWLSLSGSKWPVPVDLRNSLLGNPEERAEKAYNVMVQAMQESGSYQSVRFEDQALMYAIQTNGGWIQCCRNQTDLNDDSHRFWLKDFLKCYIRGLGNESLIPQYFVGLFENHNTAHSASFTRGNIPEIEVHVYDSQGKMELKAPAQIAEGEQPLLQCG